MKSDFKYVDLQIRRSSGLLFWLTWKPIYCVKTCLKFRGIQSPLNFKVCYKLMSHVTHMNESWHYRRRRDLHHIEKFRAVYARVQQGAHGQWLFAGVCVCVKSLNTDYTQSSQPISFRVVFLQFQISIDVLVLLVSSVVLKKD